MISLVKPLRDFGLTADQMDSGFGSGEIRRENYAEKPEDMSDQMDSGLGAEEIRRENYAEKPDEMSQTGIDEIFITDIDANRAAARARASQELM